MPLSSILAIVPVVLDGLFDDIGRTERQHLVGVEHFLNSLAARFRVQVAYHDRRTAVLTLCEGDEPVTGEIVRRNPAQGCRIDQRKDRLDMQQKDFYDRVRKGYLALAKNNSPRYVVVDATRSIEDVASSIWKIVTDLLNTRNGKE